MGRNWGENRSHPRLVIKEGPPSLVELRRLLALPQNSDLAEEGMKAATFEEAIGSIAAKLNILLDGDYEPEPLFAMLCEAIRNRDKPGMQMRPHLLAKGLVNAEVAETTTDFIIEEKKEDVNVGIDIEHGSEVHRVTERDSAPANNGHSETTDESRVSGFTSDRGSDTEISNS